MAAPAPAPAPAAAGAEASIDPPAPGMMAMPPRTLAAQRVIDCIYAVPGPVAAAAAAADDEAEGGLSFAVALRKFRVQLATQLSPIQSVWQQGEFIRLALDADQLAMAIHVATVFIRSLPHASVEAALFAGPGRSLFLDTAARSDATGAPTLQGADVLLFLAYYMPLCPDLGDSLALLKQIVRTVAPSVSPTWISTILQADDYQFYIFKFTSHFSNWFHVMRRDHTLAAAKWLLGPEQPMPVQIASIGSVHTVRALEHAPPAIRDLILNAILHTQTRAVILAARAVVVHQWMDPAASHALDAIDQHLAMHAPPTDSNVVYSARQVQIMNDLVEQMTRTATSDVPFDIAGLVMDYVRRDESLPNAGSKLTPYKQAENEHMRRRIGWVQADMAAEQVAVARARPTPATAHPRPPDGEEEEKQRAQHARLSARFLSYAPATHW